MVKAVVSGKSPSLGAIVKRERTAQSMTQRELAKVAGVSTKEVAMFERSLPVPLDIKRRLLKELWARKTGR